jgi:hypothetical protein
MSEDSRTIATAGDPRGIRLWHLHDLAQPRLLRCDQEPILALAFQPGGTRLASLSARSLRVWDVAEAVQLFETTLPFDQGSGPTSDWAFRKDGTPLLVGGHVVRIFDSVSQTARSAAAASLRAARPQAEQVVGKLLATPTDCATAAAQLRADPKLSPEVRAMALDLLLAEMFLRLPPRPR